MSKYRKKPIVIEAVQVESPAMAVPQWLSDAMNAGDVWFQGGEAPYFTIRTLEGDMRASLGDWIIQGVQGELYPCKPDIFAATYECAA